MRLTVISNNLANVNTTGFKRDRAMFEDLLYQNVRQAGGQTAAATQAPTGLMLGTGTRIIATEKIHAQGNMINTQNALDVAIQGEGFFQIQQPDGTTAYTRDGTFKLSNTGQLVTNLGQPLVPAIAIPANAASITIGLDGVVSAELFAGGGAHKETIASGAAVVLNPNTAPAGQLRQGMLEASNVNVVEEMVNMIETQRAYEVNSKAISAADGMLRFLNNNL
jgi:flagellar basal-body rod protein FlgG